MAVTSLQAPLEQQSSEKQQSEPGNRSEKGGFDLVAAFFPRNTNHCFYLVTAYLAFVMVTTLPWGLSYNRFDTRAFNCYDPTTYFKLDPDITANDPWCVILTYPYRLISPTLVHLSVPWILYLAHQLGQWFVIRQAQLAKERGEVSWAGVDGDPFKPNVYAKRMFLLNILMVIIKAIQGHITYDGLAATVPEWSALYSVALWIPIPMLVEMPRRGLWFGWVKGFPENLGAELIPFVRKYHGYAISFGTTYNFWYHPMEGTPGFIFGYTYQFVMIMQSSLLFTPLHKNKFWTLVCELGMIPHSIFVAMFIANGSDASIFQFGLGFSMLFFITHMHGFDISVWNKLYFFVAYLLLAFGCYTWAGRTYSRSWEVMTVGSSSIFVPCLWIIWLLGKAVSYPFKQFVEEKPQITGVFWFLVWAAQIGYFLYLGAVEASDVADRE